MCSCEMHGARSLDTCICDRLGISQMHVSRLLSRALAHLRSKLLESAEACDSPEPAVTG